MNNVRRLHVGIVSVIGIVIVVGGLTFRAGRASRVLAQAAEQANRACEDIAQHEKLDSHLGTKAALEWLVQNGRDNNEELCDLGEAVARLEERTKDQ